MSRMTQTLLELHRDGALTEVESIEVAPGGFATRITYRNGTCRMTGLGDLGIDPSSASRALMDKSITKHFLAAMQVACPKGKTLLLPWWAQRAGPDAAALPYAQLSSFAEGVEFAERELGFPVFVKPVDGNRGAGVWRCDTAKDVYGSLEQLDLSRFGVALIEEGVSLPDYRLVALGGEFICGYRRTPLGVIGDGRSTILQLAKDAQKRFRSSGCEVTIDCDDQRIARCLARSGLRLHSVPDAGHRVQLHDISNLAAGGTAEDVTHCVAPRWRDLACTITESFGTGLCGVDLACADIRSDDADYSVLEVNTCPGFDHYRSLGEHQEALVRSLYIRVLNVAPPRPWAV